MMYSTKESSSWGPEPLESPDSKTITPINDKIKLAISIFEIPTLYIKYETTVTSRGVSYVTKLTSTRGKYFIEKYAQN